MTLHDLQTGLETVCPETYERAAPPGITRAVVWHCYNKNLLYGDDVVAMGLPRVQIDIYWQRHGDTLMRDVETWLTQSGQSYNVVDIYYDDEYALRRCILQLELV